MLKAEIALSDLTHEVHCKDGVIAFGQSRIRPYRHPALETLLMRTDGQWCLIVRERLSGSSDQAEVVVERVDAAQFDERYRAWLMWPLDYVMLEVATAGRRLRVRAGMLGCAPLYARTTRDQVALSWDLADLLKAPSLLDLEIASHCLALNSGYSARHIVCGVNMLTERASLYVEPGGARYHYPAPVDPAVPSPSPDGDALAIFTGLLHQAVSARPATAEQVALELSGGMDSATVACAAAAVFGPVASKGILLGAGHHPAQAERRRAITSQLRLHDHTVDIEAFPPSLDLRPGSDQAYPHAELYLEAFGQLWGHARAHGQHLLFTGIGGDELFPAYPGETARGEDSLVGQARTRASQLLTSRALQAARSVRTFDAPASPVPVSALLAAVCQAPHLLRRGLWPVNALSDPRLVAFCHRLQPQDRLGRRTMRRYLGEQLGGEVFPDRYAKETFAHVLPAQIARHHAAITAQLHECALADLGLVDLGATLALLDEVAATRDDAATAPLISFLWLERFVRQVA